MKNLFYMICIALTMTACQKEDDFGPASGIPKQQNYLTDDRFSVSIPSCDYLLDQPYFTEYHGSSCMGVWDHWQVEYVEEGDIWTLSFDPQDNHTLYCVEAIIMGKSYVDLGITGKLRPLAEGNVLEYNILHLPKQ